MWLPSRYGGIYKTAVGKHLESMFGGRFSYFPKEELGNEESYFVVKSGKVADIMD